MTARIYLHCFIILIFLLSQRNHGEVSVTIGQNFTASTYGIDSDATPADANGAIGPDHFVEFVNGSFSIFTRKESLRIKTITDRKFWIDAGVDLNSDLDVTDPRIVFDRFSG